MYPTNNFRWLRIGMWDIGSNHPSAMRQGDLPYAIVLQQLWENGSIAIFPQDQEWRDVPIVEESESPTKF